jgi:uroporphyrinogen-III synthase
VSARAEGTKKKIGKVMITRSREGNEDLKRRLEARGFQVVARETIKLLSPGDWSAVDASLSRLSSFDWLVLTSPVGADRFILRMRELSLRLPSGRAGGQGGEEDTKPAVAVVGTKTGDVLKRAGVPVDFVPSEYTTWALAKELPRDKGRDVLLLRADIGDPELVTSLARDGFRVREHAIYRTVAGTPSTTAATAALVVMDEVGARSTSADRSLPPGRKEEDDIVDAADCDAIVFASPSAVRAFVALQDKAALRAINAKGVLAACIGPVTARAASEGGLEHILMSKVHTLDSLIEELRAVEKDEENEVRA